MKTFIITVQKSFEYEIQADSLEDARLSFDECENEAVTFWTDNLTIEEVK